MGETLHPQLQIPKLNMVTTLQVDAACGCSKDNDLARVIDLRPRTHLTDLPAIEV